MKIKQIILNNFKSYLGEHTIDLPIRPGLHFVMGQNNYDTDLGSNGSAKSTLFTDAISYCFFNKTMNGLRASNIQTWDSEDTASVELVFEIHNDFVRLYRSYNPNKLKISVNNNSYRNIQQVDLEEYLGFGSESLSAFIIGQFSKSFVDLTPTERLNLFTDILNLDYWDERAEAVKQEDKELDQEITTAETQLNNIDGTIESAKVRALRYKELSDSFESEKEEKIEYHEKQIENINQELETAYKQIEQAQKEYKESSKNYEEVAKKSRKLKRELQQYQDSAMEVKVALRSSQTAREQSQSWIDHFQELDTVCPACLQEVTENHSHQQVSSFESEIQEYDKQIEELKKQLQQQNKYISDLTKKEEELSDELREHETIYNQSASDIKRLQKETPKLEGDLDRAKGAVELEESKTNNYKVDYKKALKEQKKAEEDKEELGSFIKDANQYKEALVYWKNGFKNIKLMLINEAISVLEVELNSVLNSLGMIEWSVSCEMEKETKQGKLKKGFHVMVTPPNCDDEKPIESFSGGELQRLRLAGYIALSGLIKNRTGLHTNLLILDEPSKSLSQTGQEQLIEGLKERSVTNNEVIILIDHHGSVDAAYDGVYSVTKNEYGHSSIEFIE